MLAQEVIMDDGRQQRGLEIAALSRVRQQGKAWAVPSQSGAGTYLVHLGIAPRCSCPDHETRRVKCKHQWAVEYVLRREKDADGSMTVTETLTVSQRKTYGQDWKAYNAAQVSEKRTFQVLLHDLCRGLPNPERQPGQRGRPAIPMSDAAFAATLKVYSTLSGRRFMSDLSDAQEKGYISRLPHFNSIFNFLENDTATPILTGLIQQASLPLRSVESDFAVDSTGFMSSRFERWFDHKYGVPRQEHTWVKAHVCCGVKTNVITAVEIHDRHAADAPLLPKLVAATAENFTLREVSADKGYLSAANMEVISEYGAKPFIAFKRNSIGGANGPMWAKMYHYFCFNHEEYLRHYHKRSNVETTMMMVKSKFGDSVRSKGETAMKNEVLAKILCHNICCVIQATHELGIEPVFGLEAA